LNCHAPDFVLKFRRLIWSALTDAFPTSFLGLSYLLAPSNWRSLELEETPDISTFRQLSQESHI
jgi:hypothetical protein